QVSSAGMSAWVAAHKKKQTIVMPEITIDQLQSVGGWLFPWFVDLT
ncbi:stress protein, partial [Pseudoalteromonas sp. S2721]